jgi:hypothetical protein
MLFIIARSSIWAPCFSGFADNIVGLLLANEDFKKLG